MNVYEQVKQALQDVVAPELKALQVEIRRLDEKIDSKISALDEKIDGKVDVLSNKIDSVKSEVLTEIKRLETEINRLDEKIDGVDNKIEVAMQIRERLTALEVKLASMEK